MVNIARKEGDQLKHFKAKKKIHLKKGKIFFYFCIIFGTFFFTCKYMHTIKFANNNEQFIKYLLEDANHFKNYNNHFKKMIYKASSLLTGFNMNEPVSLLEQKFFYKKKKKEVKEMTYQKESVKEEKKGPTIYIYNTHQTEGYEAGNLKDFGITPDVMMASYLLKDRLEKQGITVLLEERRISNYLKQYNLTYDLSYYASRAYAQDVLSKNKVNLVIDLHRDALSKDLSTTTIQNKNYAKILFVVGGKTNYYKENVAIVNSINDKIKQNYPTLTRGILTREGSVYNQDLTNHSILIELGAQFNTVDEVMNTVEAIAPFLASYTKEAYGKENQTENIK